MREAVGLLEDARMLLGSADFWARGWWAEDAHGYMVRSRSARARRWSLEGALYMLSEGDPEGYLRAHRELCTTIQAMGHMRPVLGWLQWLLGETLPITGPTMLNYCIGRAGVLHALDLTINRLRGGENAPLAA